MSTMRQPRLAVLVLDDSDLVVDLVDFALHNQRVTVTGAAEGKEALRLLERHRFDLIITDLKMPGMSGMEFVSKVRASPAFGRIPIIALSGYDDQFAPDKAKEAGADLYLKKTLHAGAIAEQRAQTAGGKTRRIIFRPRW